MQAVELKWVVSEHSLQFLFHSKKRCKKDTHTICIYRCRLHDIMIKGIWLHDRLNFLRTSEQHNLNPKA